MGNLHFDPVDLDEKWRRRHVHRWEPHSLLDLLFEVRADFEQKRDRLPPSVSDIIHCVEGALLAESRPCDEIFDHLLYYTHSEGWAERTDHGRHWGKVQHRLLVNCRINQAHNLTVTFSPSFVDERGATVHAPEWVEMSYLGGSRIAERPDDEILYIKGAGRLFYDGPQSLVRNDPRYAKLAELVMATFWLTLHRLSRRFEVFVGSYVARITDDAGEIDYGLEVINVRSDTLRVLENFIEGFEAANGCDLADFWTTCKNVQAVRGDWAATVSKRLRVKETPSQHLTPKVCENLYSELERAFRYGVAQEPRETVVSAVAGRDWQVIENVAPAAPSNQKRKDKTKHLGEAKVVAFPNRHAASPANLDPEICSEFGVATREQLVALANKRLAILGRKPLAAGDYPSNKANLKRLVKMLRGLNC